MHGKEHDPAAARLRLQNGVSEILTEEESISTMAERLLALMTDFLGAAISGFWLRGRLESDDLRIVRIHEVESSASEEFRAATAERTFRVGEGLPGKVADAGEVVLVPNVNEEEFWIRSPASIRARLVSGLGVPIISSEGILGAIDFYARHELSLDEGLIPTLESIGRQVGQYVSRVRLQGELVATEGGFRAVLESVAIGIVTIDESSTIVALNPALERMFGYEPNELLGQQLTMLMPEQMRELHREGIAHHLRTGERRVNWDGIELPAIKKDGEELTVAVAFSKFERDGKVFFTGSIRDVSARRKAEAEAMALRDRLNELIESIPGIVWEAWGNPDDPEQQISYVSDYVEPMLGYSKEEWLSSPNFWLRIVHPEDKEMAAAHARATIAGESTTPNRFRWIRKDGRPVWAEAYSAPVIKERKAIGMRGVTLDVTDRVQNDQRLRLLASAGRILTASLDYEQTLSEIVDLMVPALADWCVIDLLDEHRELERLKVKHVDPAKMDLARAIESRYPTRPDADFGPPNVIRTGEPELVSETPPDMIAQAAQDDEHREILESLGIRSFMSLPISAGEEILGVLTLISSESGYRYDEDDMEFGLEIARRAGQAIRNARLFNRAEAASRAKDEFLATLSHELRTPMTAILGWSRLLLLDELDPPLQREAIETIARSAESQAKLIDEVLDVSRIVTGKLELELSQVDLARIVNQSVSAIGPAAAARKIQLRTHMEEIPALSADETRVRQIVWNLLSNAIKFTPRGGAVDVTVAARDSQILLEVTDTGIGIAPDMVRRVFDRFQQAQSSSSREHGGLGLGLAIVRHLAELHGGDASVESEGLGKGATFRVRLPIVSVVDVAESEREAGVPTPPSGSSESERDLTDYSILVVDDEETSRRLISTILRRAGAAVRSVSNVSDALDELERAVPDLLISDVGMPKRDGYELIRSVRDGSAPEWKTLPTIALTAYGRDEDRTRLLEAGFDLHMRKPVYPDQLVDIVAELLSKRSKT